MLLMSGPKKKKSIFQTRSLQKYPLINPIGLCSDFLKLSGRIWRGNCTVVRLCVLRQIHVMDIIMVNLFSRLFSAVKGNWIIMVLCSVNLAQVKFEQVYKGVWMIHFWISLHQNDPSRHHHITCYRTASAQFLLPCCHLSYFIAAVIEL